MKWIGTVLTFTDGPWLGAETFAGAYSWSCSAAVAASPDSALGLDILRHAAENHLCPAFSRRIRGWILAKAARSVWLSTAYTTFSAARRPPLRSSLFPLGFPSLAVKDRTVVNVGNQLMDYTV